jgi:hypothetical protein
MTKRGDDVVSPYLKRPLRSFEEVLRQRQRRRLGALLALRGRPAADNSNRPQADLPPLKSA